MSAAAILAEIERCGARVVVVGDAVKIVKSSPAVVIPERLVADARAAKEAIRDALRQPVRGGLFDLAADKVIAAGPLPDMPALRWRAFVDDARRFARDWGERAEALGWSPPDAYGHSAGPAAWSDVSHLGLCWLLNGQRVAAMGKTVAQFSNRLVWRKPLTGRAYGGVDE